MADKVPALSLSDLTAPRDDSMVQGYAQVAQARDEAASPIAQLIRRRRESLTKTFDAELKVGGGASGAGMPDAGAGPTPRGGSGVEAPSGPAAEPDASGAPGRDILPSAGEVLKAIPGGILLAAKRFGETLRDLAAAAHATGVSESAQEIADAEGITLEEAKKQTADSDPLGRVFIKALTRASEAVPQTGEPPSLLGGFFKEAVSFLTPFMPIARSLRAAPEIQRLMAGGAASKASASALEGALAGLPAGVIALDSANPANLVNALPDKMRPAALEFLAAPVLQAGEEIALEQRFKERLKASAVGAVVGAPLDLTAGAIIAARQAMRLRAAKLKFDRAVEAGLGIQRAGERGAATVEEAAGPLAHDRRKVALPAPTERRGVGAVEPAAEIQAVERSMAGQPADKIEAAINKRVGVPDQSVSDQVRATIKDGGATFDPRTGTPAPYGDKFVVSNTRGGAMRTPVSDFSSDHVAAFRGAHADELLEQDAFHGTWIKDGTVYQDVSRRVSTIEEAQKIAAQADEIQQAIWDEANNVAIPVTSLRIPGDPSSVVVDADMAAAVFGKASLKPEQEAFVQSWVRQAADAANVTPAEMQAASKVAVQMELALGDDAAELAPVMAQYAKRMFEDGVIDLPASLRNDAGFTKIGMLWFLSRTAAGALFGATGEGTMEDKIAGSIFGGAVAASLSPKLAGQLVKRLARVAEREKAVRTKAAQVAGVAGEPIKPEADTFGSLADEYAERVRLATRGEEVNPETGLTTVRPRARQAAEAEVVRQQMTPESIQQLMPTIRMNDSESIAMAQVMTEVGLKVRSLAISAQQGGFRPDDVNELLKELYVMGRMDPKRLGALAEAGRTLGALNDPVSGMNDFLNQFTEVFKNANSTVTPQRMVDALASFKTPEELAVFARQLTKPGFKDYFFEVWINGLLSGPKTLIVNGLGNTTFLLYNIGERGLAGAIRSQDGVAPGEAAAMLHGIVQAHQDALTAFWRIVRDADEIPDVSKLDQPRKAITAENLGRTGAAGQAIDFLGSAIRTPGRVLAGTDEFFKAIASRAEIRAMAKREAYNEVEKLGLRGSASVKKMHDIEQAFLLDPPARAMQKARQFSEYVTFTSELGETGQAIQALQRTALGRVVVPFVKTPINLAKRGLERSGPLGLVSGQLRAELNAADPAVRDLARAKVALSSMTLSVIAVMAANGYVTGGGPQDPILRKQWMSAGYQPYSFDVGAMLGRVGPPKPGDLVQFSRLDPIAMPFGMVADVVNIMGHLPPDEQEDLASALVIAFSKNFTSKTFVQGVARATGVMADPERMGPAYLKNFLVAATIPFSSLVRQAATALDPEMKDAQGIIEEYARRIPGASTSVPGDLDLFGNPRYLGGGLGRDLVPSTFVPAVDFVVPIYVSTAAKEHQDIFKILNENSIRVAEPPKSIDGVVLSNVEIAELKKIAGKEITPEQMTMPQALKKLFQSPAFKAAAPGRGEGREALVNIVVRGYYKGAAEVLQDRFKDLKRDVRNKRVERMRSMGVNPQEIERVRALIGVE